MRFVDEASILVRSGKGGDGMVSFRREKFVPKGGPDGGNGGRGGDVVLTADRRLKTLLDFRYKRQYKAENGAKGGSNRRTGRSGKDLVIRVPVGTIICNISGELIADMKEEEQEVLIARGGRPGAGNSQFALPWRQAPDFATAGKDGEEIDLRLELKLIADIGIIGLPNAGKSTLINRVSSSRARVADYPFTTLVPNLGVVKVGPGESFVIADMPGLIEGASGGTGLGLRFLRHCERAGTLVHLVDVSVDEDPIESLVLVERELAAHHSELEKKPKVIVANKIDQPGTQAACSKLRRLARDRKALFFSISAITGEGVQELVRKIAELAAEPTDKSGSFA